MRSTLFIPYNTPSSKNSKVWTGKYLINSKTTQTYIRASKPYWITQKKDFLEITRNLPKPYKVHFYFIRKSKHKFDLINVCQIVCDQMVAHGWIEDDNADEIIPIFDGYKIDKQRPGVFIDVEL